MATDVVMPRLSDTMESGTVAKWLKREGDEIKRGDIIAEIETDKANMDLEAYANGILAQIIVGEGQSADLGKPIATIAADKAEAQKLKSEGPQVEASARNDTPPPPETVKEEAAPQESASAPTSVPIDQDLPAQGPPAAPQNGKTEPNERLKASPLARRLAQEHGVDLLAVGGTGPGGRITKENVQSYLRQAGQVGRVEPIREPAPAGRVEQAVPTDEGLRGAHPVEMTRMRQTIARRLSEARFTAPDFLLTAEIDMTDARGLLRGLAGVEDAPGIGPNDLLVKAVAAALVKHPEANAGWEDGRIVRYQLINIGIAVATPGGGLVVPVVRQANTLSLGQTSAEAKSLIEKARSGKLSPADWEGGTFTISNLGMYGIDQFTSILNPPEACSLAVGAITPRPVVVDGEITVRDRMRVTLTCDHRVINGAEGAEFLRTLRHLLEHPLVVVVG